MIHVKYKCKVNFVKLSLIWIYRCLKLIFKNATAGRNTGCRSVVNRASARRIPTHPAFPAFLKYLPSVQITSCETRFTRGRVRELKNAHNSVTFENRTHVYMNFFNNKDLGNHLLQLCPKVVKHPVSNETEPQFKKIKTLQLHVCGGKRSKILTVNCYWKIGKLFMTTLVSHILSAWSDCKTLTAVNSWFVTFDTFLQSKRKHLLQLF